MAFLPHQQRVVEERDELAGRLSRLNAFIGGEIYRGLPEAERIRLAKQAELMKQLLDLLVERIAAF
jgi:hypothetical protein